MSGQVSLPGVPSNALPNVYVQLTVPGTSSGSPGVVDSLLILGNPQPGSPAASAAAGTVYGPTSLTPLNTLANMQAIAGNRATVTNMYSVLTSCPWPVFYAPTAMATGSQSTQTVTITAAGGSSQTTGVVQYTVAGFLPLQATFASTDSASTIATNLALAINANVSLPVTAAASSNTVVLTSALTGARFNFLRGFAQVVSGSGVTVSPNKPTFFTGGAGSDATGVAATLNAIAASGQATYYYIVPDFGMDGVDGYNQTASNYSNYSVAQLQTFIDTQAQPFNGNRMRAVLGSNDTVGNSQQSTYSSNEVRFDPVILPNSDLLPGVLAANVALAFTTFETEPIGATGVNFDNFGGTPATQAFWSVPAPLDGSALSRSNQQSLVDTGLSPIKVLGNTGRTAIVKAVTGYFFFPADPGTGPLTASVDYRMTDHGSNVTCDRLVRDLASLISIRTASSTIGADTTSGSPPAVPGVTTPDNVFDMCSQEINTYAAAGLISGPQTLAQLQVFQNVNPPTAIGIILPIFTSNLLHQVFIQASGLPALAV